MTTTTPTMTTMTTPTTTNDGVKRGFLALLAMAGVAGGVLLVLGAAERKGTSGAPPRASNPTSSLWADPVTLKSGTGGKGASPKVLWKIQQDDAGGPTFVVFDMGIQYHRYVRLVREWSDPKRAERFAIHAAAAFAKHLKKHGVKGGKTVMDRSTGWWSKANAPDLAG
jgi:hypothetical protein